MLGVGLPIAFLYWAAFRGVGEDGYRYAGLVFQILGLVTVVIGIGKTRAEFGAGWSRALSKWYEQIAIGLGLEKPPTQHIGVSGIMPSISVRGEATVGLPPDATLEQRVALHDRLIEGLRSRIRRRSCSRKRTRRAYPRV